METILAWLYFKELLAWCSWPPWLLLNKEHPFHVNTFFLDSSQLYSFFFISYYNNINKNVNSCIIYCLRTVYHCYQTFSVYKLLDFRSKKAFSSVIITTFLFNWSMYKTKQKNLLFLFQAVHANYNLNILMSSNQPSLFQHHKIFDIAGRIRNITITNTNIDKLYHAKCKDK